jgi:xanthine dehydrogenase YagS FAD-binding subunit
MKPFTYERAADPESAVKAAAEIPGARFIAGGTNLLDLMKLEIERPAHLIDVGRLPLATIDDTPDGGLRIGAMATNSRVAGDPRVRPASQQGVHGRQSAATHPLPVLLRHQQALQ